MKLGLLIREVIQASLLPRSELMSLVITVASSRFNEGIQWRVNEALTMDNGSS